MKNLLYQTIQNDIEDEIEKFLQRVSSQYPTQIDVQECQQLWKRVSKKKITTRKRKMNCYHLFMKEQRPLVLKETPTLKFADVSREMGRRWRALSLIEKDQYKQRAILWERYRDDETWKNFIEKPLKQVVRIAKNWLEDTPHLHLLRQDMNKEQVIELIIQHLEIPEDDQPSTSEFLMPIITQEENEQQKWWKLYETMTYRELLQDIKKEFPAYSDGSFTSKDDLIQFVMEHRHQPKPVAPIEVHPYYYELVNRSVQTLRSLCKMNFDQEKDDWENKNKRQLMEVLIRNFEHLQHLEHV